MEAQALIEKLMDSRDDADIMAAARELAPRKGLAPHAARLLVDLLNSGTAARAAAAAFVLGEWGGTALGTSPGLITSLRRQTAHENVTVRHWCVAALMRFGNRSATAVPELIACLRDPDDGVRSVAAHALAELPRHAQSAISALVEAIHDSSDDVRRAAIAAIARIDPHGKRAVPEIAGGLASSSARARMHAAEALGGLRTAASSAAPALFACLRDANAGVRLKAVAALSRILPADLYLLNALGVALHDADEEVRAEAVSALALFESAPRNVAPHLIAALRDRESSVRFRAIEILQRFAPDFGPMIPAVSVAIGNCLRDPSELVQMRAVRASGMIAQWTHRADPRLVNALYDAEPNIRLAATLALARSHNDPAAIDALRFRLADEHADVRVAACRALIECGESASVVVPTLIHELSDSNPAVQLDAIAAFDLLGERALPALDALRDKSADSNAEVRAAAVRVVAKLRKMASIERH